MSRSPSKGRARAAAALLCVAVSTLSGCAGLRQALSPAPKGAPSGPDGWLVYSVRAFRFEVAVVSETDILDGLARSLFEPG